MSVIDSGRGTGRRAEGLGKFVQEQGKSTYTNNENSMTRKRMKDKVKQKENEE